MEITRKIQQYFVKREMIINYIGHSEPQIEID